MKNYKIWLVIVLALFAVNSVVLGIMWFQHKRPLMAHEHGDARQQRMEVKDVLINTLKLSPKQQELYAKMIESHQQISRALNEQSHTLHDSLFSNIKKPKIDSVLINTITKKISDNQIALEKATLYHFRSFRAILTPEQQNKFDGIINDVLHMMSHHGPMRGRPEHSEPGNGSLPDNSRRQQMGRPHGMPPRGERRDGHFGPPPNGMPPPDGDRRHHHGPPPGGRPPGPDGMPPDGPPPDGRPPEGHPPL